MERIELAYLNSRIQGKGNSIFAKHFAGCQAKFIQQNGYNEYVGSFDSLFSLRPILFDSSQSVWSGSKWKWALPKQLSQSETVASEMCNQLKDVCIQSGFNTVIFCAQKENNCFTDELFQCDRDLLIERLEIFKQVGIQIGLELQYSAVNNQWNDLDQHSFLPHSIDYAFVRASRLIDLDLGNFQHQLQDKLRELYNLLDEKIPLILFLDDILGRETPWNFDCTWEIAHRLPSHWIVAFHGCSIFDYCNGQPLSPLIEHQKIDPICSYQKWLPIVDWTSIPFYSENWPLCLDALIENLIGRQQKYDDRSRFFGMGCLIKTIPLKGQWLDCLIWAFGLRMWGISSHMHLKKSWISTYCPSWSLDRQDKLYQGINRAFQLLLQFFKDYGNSISPSKRNTIDYCKKDAEFIIEQLRYMQHILDQIEEENWKWNEEQAVYFCALNQEIGELSQEMQRIVCQIAQQVTTNCPQKLHVSLTRDPKFNLLNQY